MMSNQSSIKRILVLGLAFGFVLVFTGCGKSVTIKNDASVTEMNGNNGIQARATPTARAVRGRQTAVRHLMTSANRQAREGHYSTAAELLERGLRIDPYNAQLWGSLAGIRFKQKQYRLSESLAHKSNSFAENNRVLKLKNWRLIADSRDLRGNKAGAKAASQKVSELLQ